MPKLDLKCSYCHGDKFTSNYDHRLPIVIYTCTKCGNEMGRVKGETEVVNAPNDYYYEEYRREDYV